jgi:hypothetical protein
MDWIDLTRYIDQRNVLLNIEMKTFFYRLCSLVVIVPGYRSRGPGSIPSATRFSET